MAKASRTFDKKDQAVDYGKQVEVTSEGVTAWLSQRMMAELFSVNVPAISKHLKNIFKSGELN